MINLFLDSYKNHIEPYYNKEGITIYNADCLSVMKELDEQTFNLTLTSPPYWTQRSYGNNKGEIGLENTPEEYIDVLVEIFSEVKRILKKDGVFWLNIDDVYYGSGHGKSDDLKGSKQGTVRGMADENMRSFFNKQRNQPHSYLKKKDLCLVPERLIDRLQRNGWWIRSKVIWQKPNAMPENVRDRPTNDYEFLYLLTKSGKYFFNQLLERNGRNFRAVWSINTQLTEYEHPAKYPIALCEKAILCGSNENDFILDPFMGSGTTLVAAKKLGRKAVGIEINEKYCEIAVKRLNEIQIQDKLF